MILQNGQNPVEYLLSIYARSLGYSSSICKAKIKNSDMQRKQKATVVSTPWH